MTYQEIIAKINELAFNPPANNSVVISIPFIIPQVLFSNDMEMIKRYAVSRGYSDILIKQKAIIEEALDPDGKPYDHTRYVNEEYPNPKSELQWACDDIRDRLREDFANFVKEDAKKQAEILASQQIEAIFS